MKFPKSDLLTGSFYKFIEVPRNSNSSQITLIGLSQHNGAAYSSLFQITPQKIQIAKDSKKIESCCVLTQKQQAQCLKVYEDGSCQIDKIIESSKLSSGEPKVSKNALLIQKSDLPATVSMPCEFFEKMLNLQQAPLNVKKSVSYQGNMASHLKG